MSRRRRTNKVPILGDIPILGYPFQEKLNARTKRNLLVFVTPTVIKQGYGTGLEVQVTGLTHSGEEFADPNGWRNNAKGADPARVPTSNRQIAADVAKPGFARRRRKSATVRTRTGANNSTDRFNQLKKQNAGPPAGVLRFQTLFIDARGASAASA